MSLVRLFFVPVPILARKRGILIINHEHRFRSGEVQGRGASM